MLATKISPFMAPDYDVFTPARRSDRRGVVLGAPLDGAQAYTPWIGLSTVRELALKFPDRVGLVDAELLREAEEEGDRWKREAEALRLQVEALTAKNERIAGLVSDGFKVQRIQGRPRKVDE
jgi:hypothetical protein